MSLNTFVLDIGSALSKCGWPDSSPRAVFPTLIGKPKHQAVMCGTGNTQYVGDRALHLRGMLSLVYPVEHGMVTNWDDLEKIYHHAFYNEVKMAPEEHTILVTEPPLNPKINRQKIASTLFEVFQVPGMYMAISSVLALHSAKKTTGLVVELGDGVTTAVPIIQGQTIINAMQRFDFGGAQLTKFLLQSLKEKKQKPFTSSGIEVVREMKEQCTFVALNFEEETKNVSNRSYVLPDGQLVQLGDELAKCGEALFRPSIGGFSIPGIHEIIYDTIMKCDVGCREELFRNICVFGGTTRLTGFLPRLEKELKYLVPSDMKVNIIPETSKYSAWFGGAVIAENPAFQDLWISKSEYDECGPSIVHKMCY